MFNTEVSEWIDGHTQHIDLVKSWEAICETYRYMQFTDEINDNTRIEETKWIVKEINRFLTAIRKKLMSCKSMEAIQEILRQSFVPAGKIALDSRKALVYQKYKQTWIEQMLADSEQLNMHLIQQEMMEAKIEEGTDYGWREYSEDSEW